MINEALAPLHILTIRREAEEDLIAKGLSDIEPLLVNRFVVRSVLSEEGVHGVTMLLCAQVRQAILPTG